MLILFIGGYLNWYFVVTQDVKLHILLYTVLPHEQMYPVESTLQDTRSKLKYKIIQSII